MKKFLLFSAAVLTAASASAQAEASFEPTVLPEFQGLGISGDSKTLVSELYGKVTLYDIATKQTSVFEDMTGMGMGYSVGNGNFISDEGVIVGADNDHASYLKDGEWVALSTANPDFSSSANAITPDGSRITGYMGLSKIGTEDTATPMAVPAVWTRNADGTYGEPVALPYPALDFSGRVPQYVIGVCISPDGKTVVGQIRDYSGYACELIVFNENVDGEWEYDTPYSDMLNPNNADFPEWPGEFPAPADPVSFLSGENLEAYNAAYQAWVDSGYNFDLFPNAEDYMTDEEKDAYHAAQEEYLAAAAIYDEKFAAFMEVFNAVTEVAQPIEFNTLNMNPAGNKVGCVIENSVTEPGAWFPLLCISP